MEGTAGIWPILRRAGKEFGEDNCPRLAAALSYYAVFSLPPLLILVVLVTSIFVDASAVEGRLSEQIRSVVGPEGAAQIETMMRSADRPGTGGTLSWILGGAALLFGATGVFGQLQAALNEAWEVEPDPDRGGIARFLLKRLLSLGMVLSVGFLLLVSLVLSAFVSGAGGVAADLLPDAASRMTLRIFELAGSLVLFSLLFGAIFVILPDAKVAWKDVWTGAVSTAALFVAGKYLIGLYIGRSDPASTFGAAGSLAIVFLWVYYSALIFLFGAELTQSWARGRGRGIVPDDGAVRAV